jgi:hypothetical protein
MKRMKEKYTGFLNQLDDFTESNQTIEKKELTKIKNSFDRLYGDYYGGDKVFHEKRKKDLEQVAIKKGVSIYPYENPDLAMSTLGMKISNYGISDAQRNINKFDEVKFTKDEQKFIDKYYSNFDKWSDLNSKIEEIRTILNPTAKERREKELKEIKGKLNPQIKTVIDEIAEDFREVIETTELKNYERSLERFREVRGDSFPNNETQDRKFKWIGGINIKLYQKPKDAGYTYDYDLTLVDDYQDIMEKTALSVSHSTIMVFIRKMYDKIGGLVSDIDKDFRANVVGSDMSYNDINFIFNDNSKFSIRNQIVSKISNQGTFFYTYPTTFHDAYLPDGEKIPNPNEYSVKNAFNSFYDEVDKFNL